MIVRRPQNDNTKCVTGDPCLPTVGYPESDTWCADLDTNTECWAKYNCNTSCYNTETPQNNYIGLRTITGENTLYGTLLHLTSRHGSEWPTHAPARAWMFDWKRCNHC